jgi:hypothetical protein
MIKMTDILKEIIESKPWAFYVDSEDDWMILSNLLKQKGYKFTSGTTISDRDIVDFNPFKSDRPFGDDGSEDGDFGYSYAMSYSGKNDFMVIQKPKKKIILVDPSYFYKRKNSTYKNYQEYTKMKDIIPVLEYLK